MNDRAEEIQKIADELLADAKRGKLHPAAKLYGCVCTVISLAQYLLPNLETGQILGAVSGSNPFFMNSPFSLLLVQAVPVSPVQN